MNIAEAALVVDGVVVRKAQGNGGVVSMLQDPWPVGATLLVKNINIPGATTVEEMPEIATTWPIE